MIYQGRASRRAAQVARSQLAVRLGLALYAALSAGVAMRLVVLLLGMPANVWSVNALLSGTAPIVFPLSLMPGANRVLMGSATLADVTTAVVLLALPLPLLGRRRQW